MKTREETPNANSVGKTPTEGGNKPFLKIDFNYIKLETFDSCEAIFCSFNDEKKEINFLDATSINKEGYILSSTYLYNNLKRFDIKRGDKIFVENKGKGEQSFFKIECFYQAK